jgi:2-keto-3-deoxy-L-rhamnonate aldolase RhmA
MIENTILRKNRQGLKAVVLSLGFPATALVELAAQAGFDAVHLDGEHGAFTPEAAELMCRAANGLGLSVTARVPNIAPSTINLWLDRGVQGVVGPHIETGAEARQLADACLFPPAGWRSWGGGRGTEFNDGAKLDATYGGKLGFARWANANMLVFAQIESRTGSDNLDAILAVSGLSGITGGPNDLAASLGHPGEPDHPERVRLTAEVEGRARAAGKRVASDLMVMLAIEELMLRSGREFVATHGKERAGRVPAAPVTGRASAAGPGASAPPRRRRPAR